MEIYLNDKYNTNAVNMLRKCGYIQIFDRQERKTSYAKALACNSHYPRFHIYIKKDSINDIHLHLHLDMTAAQYGNNLRHNAEYDSEVVKKEAMYIKSIFQANINKYEFVNNTKKDKTKVTFWSIIKKMFGF